SLPSITFASFSPFIPPRPRLSTLFPYTTLFRSSRSNVRPSARVPANMSATHSTPAPASATGCPSRTRANANTSTHDTAKNTVVRSEEHTSELQSRENLVCRLLLEKKKKQSQDHN